MDITFAPRGVLQIDDARIIWQNFSGRVTEYNREGKRSFNLIIETQEQYDALVAEGWNVRIKESRYEGEPPLMVLPVKVNFNQYGPNIYLISGKNRQKLNPDTVGILDNMEYANIDMDINPRDSVVNGKEFRTAYLQGMEITQDFSRDRFAARYAEEEYPE